MATIKPQERSITSIAAARLLAKPPGEKRLTFSQEFKARLAEIERRMDLCGSNWSELCTQAKVSRAQPNRYRVSTPKTIELVDRLERALIALEKSRKG